MSELRLRSGCRMRTASGSIASRRISVSGSGSTCRDNGSGTKDCEIVFDASRSTTYYAILAPAKNAYGWRITYVGVGGA